MKAIHFINRRNGANLVGLDRWKDQEHGFRSCCWQLSDEQATALMGGWLYLHGSKAERSSFGGQILGFEQGEGEMADRKIILFRADTACRGQTWRGADHAMAYNGGIITADVPHERERRRLTDLGNDLTPPNCLHPAAKGSSFARSS